MPAMLFWHSYRRSTRFPSVAFAYWRPGRCGYGKPGAASFSAITPDTMLIRVWMRTAVRKDVTSFGTFLSTLCHEFCHHLDFKNSDSLTPGTPAASMSAPERFITVCAELLPSACSGRHYEAAAGRSTGRGPIAGG